VVSAFFCNTSHSQGTSEFSVFRGSFRPLPCFNHLPASDPGRIFQAPLDIPYLFWRSPTTYFGSGSQLSRQNSRSSQPSPMPTRVFGFWRKNPPTTLRAARKCWFGLLFGDATAEALTFYPPIKPLTFLNDAPGPPPSDSFFTFALISDHRYFKLSRCELTYP